MYTLRFVRLPIAMILMTLAAHECGAGVVSPVSGDLEVFGQQGTNSQVNSDLILGALPIGVTRTASGTGFQSTGVYMLNSSLFNIAATQSRSGLAGSTADANGQRV